MVGKGPARRGRGPLVSPLCNEKWTLDPNKKALYPSALEMVRLISDELGFNKGELSLHSARNFLPTCASQLGWDLDDRRKVGHWAPGSEMPGKYDRAFCVTEQRLRGNIFSKIGGGWAPAISYEVPNVTERGNSQNSEADTIRVGAQDTAVFPSPENKQEDATGNASEQSDGDTSTGTVSAECLEEFSDVDIADLRA